MHGKRFTHADYQQLVSFYQAVDEDYMPRLSARADGIEGHIRTILDSGGSFAFLEKRGDIIGAAGWRDLDSSRTIVQFMFFTFLEKFRNGTAPYRLARFLVDNRKHWGYQNLQKIVARTWYPESADRMQRLGFSHVASIQGDVMEGRTSHYFEGDVAKIESAVLQRKAYH